MGLNVDSVLLGGNSFDGLTPWLPEEILPSSEGSFDEIMLALLGASVALLAERAIALAPRELNQRLRNASFGAVGQV